jgi:hypothetical protein
VKHKNASSISLILLVLIKLIKHINESIVNKVKKRSPRAGIQTTDQTLRGFVIKSSAPSKANRREMLIFNNKKKREKPIRVKIKIFDR